MSLQLPDNDGRPITVSKQSAGDAVSVDAAGTQKAKKTHTLTDMSKDYAFFTVGVVQTVTPLDRDIVYDCSHGLGIAELPVIIDYARPFFKGLGSYNTAAGVVKLNNRLYAIPHEYWEVFRNMLAGIEMVDWQKKFYATLSCNDVDVIDYFLLEKMAVVDKPPTVQVGVFVVSSADSCAFLRPQFENIAVPSLVIDPPDPEVVSAAEKLFVPGPFQVHKQRKKNED